MQPRMFFLVNFCSFYYFFLLVPLFLASSCLPFLVFPLNLNKWMENVYPEPLCFSSVVQWHIAVHHPGSGWPVQTQQHAVFSRYEGEPFSIIIPHYSLCISIHSRIYLGQNQEANNHIRGAINCRLANRCTRPTRTSWTSRVWSVPLCCQPGTIRGVYTPPRFPLQESVVYACCMHAKYTLILFFCAVLPRNETIGCRPSPWRSMTTPRRKSASSPARAQRRWDTDTPSHFFLSLLRASSIWLPCDGPAMGGGK